MRPNAWVGLTAIVIGIVYAFNAYNIPRAPIGNPMSPIYFPLGLGIIMVLFGALAFAIEAKKGLNTDDKAKRPQFHLKSLKLILYVIALCLAYAAIFDHAGFVFSTILFLMAMLWAINGGAQKFKQNAIITLCYSFGMWYIFVHLFQISLPNSPLGTF